MGQGNISLSCPFDTKLINNRSKKETDHFIHANLKIVTRETVFQKAMRIILPARGQSRVI